MRGRRTSAGLAVLVLLLAACSGGEDLELSEEAVDEEAVDAGDVDGEAAESNGEGWTYLLYVMGDTDLEPFALGDLEELAEVGSQDGLDIVAIVDRSPDYSADGVVDQDDWEGTKVFAVQPGSLEEIADLGERNLGTAEELAAFVADALAAYPNPNVALTLWDHGAGWTGVGPDETDGADVLDLAEITAGLEQGLAAAGRERVDLLGFDACLMATYEVASAVAPYAGHLIASEELEPGHGWDYRRLQALADDPSLDAASLGREVLDGYRAQAEEWGTGSDITLSLLDLGAMPALDAAVAGFAAAMAAQGPAIAPVVGGERAEVLEFAKREDPSESTNLVDLGVLATEIGARSLPVADAADAVARGIGDVVVERVNGPARAAATGLSIFFPTAAQYANPAYRQVASATAWGTFLDAYHGVGTTIAPEQQPAFVTDATLELVEDGLDITAALDPATLGGVVSATMYYGYVDPEDGAVVLLGDDQAEVADDGTVTAFTDLTELTITDGESTISAYLGLEVDEESGLATANVPLDYYPPDGGDPEEVELSIVFDIESGDVTEEEYYVVDESGAWGELTVEDGASIGAIVPVVSEDGLEWVAYGEDTVAADIEALGYDVVPLEAGTTVYASLDVEDFGGNVAVAEGEIALP